MWVWGQDMPLEAQCVGAQARICSETQPCSFSRMCALGGQLSSEASRRDKLSLPGFENLTAGYNKFLRPNFGGRSPFSGFAGPETI